MALTVVQHTAVCSLVLQAARRVGYGAHGERPRRPQRPAARGPAGPLRLQPLAGTLACQTCKGCGSSLQAVNISFCPTSGRRSDPLRLQPRVGMFLL